MSYETDEEKVQALKVWWQQYGNAVLTGVVVAAVIFGGWRFWQNHKISTSQAASQHYQQLLQNLEDDDQDALQLRQWFLCQRMGLGQHHRGSSRTSTHGKEGIQAFE